MILVLFISDKQNTELLSPLGLGRIKSHRTHLEKDNRDGFEDLTQNELALINEKIKEDSNQNLMPKTWSRIKQLTNDIGPTMSNSRISHYFRIRKRIAPVRFNFRNI